MSRTVGLSATELAALARTDLRRRWSRGERAGASAYIDRMPQLLSDPSAVADLVYTELVLREESGEPTSAEYFYAKYPAAAPLLARLLDAYSILSRGDEPLAGPDTKDYGHIPVVAPEPVPAGYELLDELGRGGMGVVYKARQKGLNRLVAVKMVLASVGRGEPFARFMAEGRAVARLQHPNIVQIYDVGEMDGSPFFALELVEGCSLAARLREGPLPPREAAQLVTALASAAHHAHEHNVVHRDLKPANVLLGRLPDGGYVPKIADFGLAKLLDERVGLTASGAIIGTPMYMAPEQATGRGPIGPAADVWALGAILYECLTGVPPFKAATFELTVVQVVHDQPLPPSRLRAGLPPDLEGICLKCLTKDPAARYPSAAALADDLVKFAQGNRVAAGEAVPDNWLDLWAGRAGFELLERLGGRGDVEVFRAKQLRFRREVALKLVAAAPELRRKVLEAWEAHAVAASTVSATLLAARRSAANRFLPAAPPLAEVYDMGERDGVAYCATEFVSGGRLCDFVGRLSVREAVKWAGRVARAVAAIHAAGFAHRNLSPGNVLVTPGEAVKLTDARPDEKAGGKTEDLVGLAKLFFVLTTGLEPDGSGRPPSSARPELPNEVDELYRGCFGGPDRRFERAGEFADALEHYWLDAEARRPNVAPRPMVGQPPPAGYEYVADLGTTWLGRVDKVRVAGRDEYAALQWVELTNRLRPEAWQLLGETLRATADLRHPNIVRVIEVGARGDRHFLIREIPPGGSLAKRLTGRPWPTHDAVALVAALAGAVEYAHRRNMYHGDLGPDAVLLESDGTPKLADFRLVAAVEKRRHEPLSGPLDVMTEHRPGYKPPEFLLREPMTLSPAADVYGLGALLFELLTGVSPAAAFDRELFNPHRRWVGSEAATFGAVRLPPRLDRLCRRCMEWKPSHRHSSAGELAVDLRGQLDRGWLSKLFG